MKSLQAATRYNNKKYKKIEIMKSNKDDYLIVRSVLQFYYWGNSEGKTFCG